MIKTKQQLKECLEIEHNIYLSYALKKRIYMHLVSDPKVYKWKYVKLLRKMEYHSLRKSTNPISMVKYILYKRRSNRLGHFLGIRIEDNVFDTGLEIYHSHGTVVNGYSKIGKNCKLHGANCIGNDGLSYEAPKIGNNVDIGYGACIIGNVVLADNIIIGAGAVVVKTCLEEGAILVGVPAINIKERSRGIESIND